MSWSFRILITAGFLTAAGVLSFGALRPVKAEREAPELRTPVVGTVDVKQGALDKQVRLSADLLPYEVVDIYTKFSGFIETLYADRGSDVKEKTVLARLMAPELDKQIEAARAQYLAAEDQYRRNEKLGPGALVAAQTIETLKRAAEAARENLAALQEQKNYLTVAAPFDGVITTRNLHTGAFVIAGGSAGAVPIFRLEKINTLRLVLAVPEAMIGGVQAGAEVQFSVPAYPDRTFTAKIARIADSLDLRARTEAVELDVDNADRTLLPGMYADVSWPVVRKSKTFVVPARAVATTTDKSFVIRVDGDGLTEWVDVKRGNAANGLVEVFGALHEGDTIAARATDEIKPGVKVRALKGRT